MTLTQKIHVGSEGEPHSESEKKFTDDHSCEAMVVACIDFRFQKYLRKFEDDRINGGYDLMGFAGGAKNLDLVLEEVEISKRLHKIKELYLINHEECGAYGEESTYVNHVRDLKLAKDKVKSKYPDLSVNTFYLHLSGEFEEIV